MGDNKSDKPLKKAIGPLNLIIMGLCCITGAGIFIITGVVSANYSGPALVLSFIISAIACVLTALCYAEFSFLDSHFWKRLYLYLRGHGRNLGLDDWMGLDVRISHIRFCGCCWLVFLYCRSVEFKSVKDIDSFYYELKGYKFLKKDSE